MMLVFDEKVIFEDIIDAISTSIQFIFKSQCRMKIIFTISCLSIFNNCFWFVYTRATQLILMKVQSKRFGIS